MDNMISLKITQDGKEHDITLPTDETEFENIASVQITDCVCPQICDLSVGSKDMASLNSFATQLQQISGIGKLPKLNAVLSVSQCSSVDQAITLALYSFCSRLRRYSPISTSMIKKTNWRKF